MIALFLVAVAFSLGFTFAEGIPNPAEDVGTQILSAPLASKSNANKDEGDSLGELLQFYILNLDRRRADKFATLEKTISEDAPWMTERSCRVSAPDGATWGSHVSESIVTGEVWEAAVHTTDSKVHFEADILGKGGVALVAGHGRIWEHIVQKGAPFAVVMEDDISHISPNAKSFLHNVQSNASLQSGWDFLLLQHADMRITQEPIAIQHKHNFNTGMYIIKLEAARKALQTIFPISGQARQLDSYDGPLWHNLRGAVIKPAVAEARHDITDVQQRRPSFLQVRASADIHDCPALDTSRMVFPALFDPTA